MAVNLVDYDVLEKGKTDYANQAQSILDIISKINSMNNELMNGWQNNTAQAFVERIKTDHIPKLQKASAALQEVSDYIKTYLSNKQQEDIQGAHGVSGR